MSVLLGHMFFFLITIREEERGRGGEDENVKGCGIIYIKLH